MTLLAKIRKIERACELAFLGKSRAEISSEIGVSLSTVNRWAKSPQWEAHWQRLENLAHESRVRDLNNFSKDLATLRDSLILGLRDSLGALATRESAIKDISAEAVGNLAPKESYSLKDLHLIIDAQCRITKGLNDTLSILAIASGLDQIAAMIDDTVR